jgi:hypothetical protein
MQENKNGCFIDAPDGKHCGVGCLLTPEQHALIQKLGLNAADIYCLAKVMGAESLFLITGMSIRELSGLQDYHDDEYADELNSSNIRSSFRNYLVANAI